MASVPYKCMTPSAPRMEPNTKSIFMKKKILEDICLKINDEFERFSSTRERIKVRGGAVDEFQIGVVKREPLERAFGQIVEDAD